MKSTLRNLILFTISALFLASCANTKTAKMVPATNAKDLSPQYLAGEMASKVDGWIILLDNSMSMNQMDNDYIKFDIAKAFVDSLNETLPPITAVSGIRTFGQTQQDTQLIYGMAAFDRAQMGQSLSQVTGSNGPTPLSEAIQGATKDLQNIEGNKAVIIVSDGKDLDNLPVLAAQEMQKALDNNVCIYTVLVGNDKKGKMVMERIANVSSCGFMVSAMDLLPADPMAEYVTDIFLSEKAMGLGYHKAPDLSEAFRNIQFKYDNAQLTQEGKSMLDQSIKALSENPNVKVNIEGHASAKGAPIYNQKLSEKRAQSVRDYLISAGGIASDRLNVVGFGANKPLAVEANPELIDSPEAKSNMRVVLSVIEE